MSIIHQAIYGEVLGKTSGHGLLAASDEKNKLFSRASGYTDLADRPEDGVLSSFVVRGLFVEDHFLLIKTFPDRSPGLRSGRVFSHALFIPKTDLHQVSNLSNLFKYHLNSIQKEVKMHSFEYVSQEANTIMKTVDGRETAATNALLENQPFVWLGEEGYWEWIDRIWDKLPTREKQNLKIGAAFGPSYAKNDCLNLLYIPEDAETLWERNSFRVIDKHESQSLQSLAASWLVEDAENTASFEMLFDDFSPKIDSIEALNRLAYYGEVYHKLDSEPELNRLLVLASFISKVSLSEKVGVKGKNKLMNAIIQAIPNAPINLIIALQYQNWAGFPNAIRPITDALNDLLNHHLLKGKKAKEYGAVLVSALEADSTNWWASTVLGYTRNRLKKRQSSDAQIFWQWIGKEPTLIAQHTYWLPNDAESELIKKLPQLETAVAEAVLNMAEQKDWLVLHAKVAAQLYSAKNAIEVQLRIDTDENHTRAFQALSECIKSSSFVSEAAGHTDARLHHIAGKLITENSNLMKGIDITSEGWQNCWQAAIEQGSEVWLGISNPQYILFEILDHMLAGNSFNKTLLNAISIGKFNSLKDYPQRASIWPVLPEKARSEFVSTTLVELIIECATSKFNYKDLESELKKELQSQKLQNFVMSSKTIPLAKKLNLFDMLPGLGEHHAQQLIRNNHFLPAEAEEFGRLISKNRWIAVVEELYDNRIHRNDLLPTLLRSSHLLGLWQRFALSSSGLKVDAISSEEWWDEFLRTTLVLFPSGPDENGLWVSSGGDLSQLQTTGTGREKWSFAVQILRNNGKPKVKKLLSKMSAIYTDNEILGKLQETL